jgi:hypothetical protein
MENAKEVVKNIRSSLSQKAASHKDEIAVMCAILNDKDYTVGIYNKSGKVRDYSPSKEIRSTLSSIIHTTTKVSTEEANKLADGYQFRKQDGEAFVDLSKEFIHTYLETDRKLPLGGREKSDISLYKKEVKEGERTYPMKMGTNPDGTDRYGKGTTIVKPHTSIRVAASCPEWVVKTKG